MYVFLDLWGVLLDHERMHHAYGRRLSTLMADRFGGDSATWRQAHDAAYEDYVREADSTDWSTRPWTATVEELDAKFAVQILERMGVSWRPPDAVAFSRELDLQVLSSIDVRFPDSRSAVARLRKAGHKVYVATAGTGASARGALIGSGLIDAFDGIITGHTHGHHKSQPGYWNSISAMVAGSPARCVVVDDRLDYLEAATSQGFTALLLDRKGSHDQRGLPPFVRATLRNLASAPHFVDVLEAEGRD